MNIIIFICINVFLLEMYKATNDLIWNNLILKYKEKYE